MGRAEHATLRYAAHRSSAGVGANDARPAVDARIFAPRGTFRARRSLETLARENAIATGRRPLTCQPNGKPNYANDVHLAVLYR